MKSISVVIPTYNCAKYITSAIQSILDQAYSNLEIIVIDDGSTDNTKELIKEFTEEIIYIFQENKGLPGARNRGLQEASGEYIAFLDADDIWCKDKVKIQAKVLESFPSVYLVFSDFSVFNEDGYREKSFFRKGFPIFHENKFTINEIFMNKSSLCSDGYQDNIKIFHGNISKYLFYGNFILPSSVMIRKSAIDQLGGFDENYKIAEETEFFLRYCTDYDAAYIDYPLVDYLIKRTGKLTGSSNTERLIKNAICIQREYIQKHPYIYNSNKIFFNKAIAKSYARLAYYYLTVTMSSSSRQEAMNSISWMPLQFKAYFYCMLSFCPPTLLGALGRSKQLFKEILGRKLPKSA